MGIADPDWWEDQTSERIIRMTDNQYYTVVWMSRAAWPHLVASGGNMVNTASEAMLGNVPKAASYCGAKGGVFALTRALALDGKRLGIRVNQICPAATPRLLGARGARRSTSTRRSRTSSTSSSRA